VARAVLWAMAQLASFDPIPSASRGENVVALEGDLRLEDGAAVWRRVEKAISAAGGGGVRVDLSGVGSCDAGVLALLLGLRAQAKAGGTRVELVGGDARLRALIDLHVDAGVGAAVRPRKAEGFVAHVGRATSEIFGEVRGVIEFFGQIIVAGLGVLRRPMTGNWKDVLSIMERSGADALPIVLLINGLVGFVMAFQAAHQLAQYGANIYVANLVGLSVTRELAPLMTAIIIAGRSGAAFAAELGTMKVSEEIDALRTMGFGPVRHLVLPRVIGLVLVAPFLTLFGDIIGIVGGLLVGIGTLGLSTTGYMNQTFRAVEGWDVQSGLLKSVVFAITIALIACQQGFATSGGAAGVGRRATSTVVSSLFAIVILDALFTIVFRYFDA
jgi:phospholipid/cholesterol/gamma-HCH transport system permease protein